MHEHVIETKTPLSEQKLSLTAKKLEPSARLVVLFKYPLNPMCLSHKRQSSGSCNLEVQFKSVYMRIKTPPFYITNLSQPHECTCAGILGKIKKVISLKNKIKETNLCV